MQPPAASEFYATQQALSTVARNELGRLWDGVGDQFGREWARRVPAATRILSEARLQAAKAAAVYVPTVLEQAGIPDRPEGELRPEQLAGVASDGRRLDTLVGGASAQAALAIRDGESVRQARTEGGEWLRLVAALQVADAARVAAGVMGASRKNLGGHVRVLNLPVCQRCAVLGGRFYRWSSGFDRHPNDDCTMMPVPSEGYARAEGFLADPNELARSGGVKDLTPAQAQAIEDGADISQVVNAYRGISTTSLESAAGVRRRKLVAQAQANPVTIPAGQSDLLGFLPDSVRYPSVPDVVLPTPEGIYRTARTRDEAVGMLRDFGYIR